MATVLEEHPTEEHRSVLRFCEQKDSIQRIFIKKCFLFKVGSVCRLKRFIVGWKIFRWWRRGWNGRCENGWDNGQKTYAAGFDALVKRWNKCINVGGGYVEKYMFFSRFEYHMFYVLYPFVTYLLTLPRTICRYCRTRNYVPNNLPIQTQISHLIPN
jgi:hypothetical protein